MRYRTRKPIEMLRMVLRLYGNVIITASFFRDRFSVPHYGGARCPPFHVLVLWVRPRVPNI